MKKQAIGLAVSAILLILIAYFASDYLNMLDPRNGIWSSVLPAAHTGEKTIRLRGLEDEVIVAWDKWGVPHIYAKSERDLAFAFGYVQAMDRLWQMDLERRLAAGRLSELLGQPAFETDLFFRTMGLRIGAVRTWGALEAGAFPELKAALEAFAAGVNAAIKDMERSGTLPVEYKLLGVEPEPWEPIDTLLVDRLICWGLTGSLDSLYLYQLLRGLQGAFGDEVGYRAVKSILPPDRPLEVDEYIIPPSSSPGPAAKEHGAPQQPCVISAREMGLGSPKSLFNVLKWWEDANSYCSFVRSLFASNNWVVSGALTASGKPILCNDPHLALTVPPTWYEAHLVVLGEGGTPLMNVRGVAFPGVPVIVIGRNDRVAWGFTNVGADVIDFYYYVWDEGGERYWYGPEGRWLTVKHDEEIIWVREGKKLVPKTVVLNFTIHGPLVERWGVRFAVKWLGHYATLEAEALRRYNWARGLEDFMEALALFQLPAQNHVYADVEGNIAWWACGRYPNRTNLDRSDPLKIWLPYNGSAGEGEWNEEDWIDPPDEVPHLINPPWGYIVTANNRPASTADYPLVYEIGWTWADYYRARRIRELIEGYLASEWARLRAEIMMAIQMDVLSIPARELVPYLLSALKIHEDELMALEKEAQEELVGWDYHMRAGWAAPTIFAAWLKAFVDAVFKDEFSKAGLEDVRIPLSMLEYFVKHPEAGAWWFDDKGTPNVVEDRDTIMVKAFKQAVEELRKLVGTERTHPPPSKWKWARVHRLKADHVMGSVLPWLNYPRLPLDGWGDCVNNLGGLNVGSGPSWRQIVDFGDKSYCVIPGGQSGNPFSPHYADQLELWVRGQYKAMDMPATPDEVEREGLWRLVPAGGRP